MATPKGVAEAPKATPKVEATPPAAPAGQSGTPQATPKVEGTVGPTEKPTQTTEACKKTVASVVSGGLPALDALSPHKRGAILGSPTGVQFITCLAVAGDDAKLCNALPEKAKAECLESRESLRDLKAVPKAGLKARVIYRLCVQGSSKEECAKIQTAITEGDAAKCKGVSKEGFRTFCEALATSDVKRCDPLPEAAPDGPSRGLCAAFASEDPRHCPKDSGDCARLTNSFATMKKQGLEGFSKSDPSVAAARSGKKACEVLVPDLANLCDDPK